MVIQLSKLKDFDIFKYGEDYYIKLPYRVEFHKEIIPTLSLGAVGIFTFDYNTIVIIVGNALQGLLDFHDELKQSYRRE